MAGHWKPLSTTETLAYLAGAQVFAKVRETEHGVEVWVDDRD